MSACVCASHFVSPSLCLSSLTSVLHPLWLPASCPSFRPSCSLHTHSSFESFYVQAQRVRRIVCSDFAATFADVRASDGWADYVCCVLNGKEGLMTYGRHDSSSSSSSSSPSPTCAHVTLTAPSLPRPLAPHGLHDASREWMRCFFQLLPQMPRWFPQPLAPELT